MRTLPLILAPLLLGRVFAQQTGASPSANSLPEVHRIYVAELIGAEGDTMRELIIAGLNSTRLFVLTDNPDRADAVLKGAADDKVFTDTLDIQEGLATHENGGKGASGTSRTVNGLYHGIGISENQSHHSKDRKHEAYAAVRLCNKDGDVLWSTTQESLGAKFRGASADVAAKVAHQLMLDVERARPGDSPDARR